MKTKKEILEKCENDQASFITMDEKYVKEISATNAMTVYARLRAIEFAEWLSKGMWTKHESLGNNGMIEKEFWYNTYNYTVMEKPLTSGQLYQKFLEEYGN